MLTWVWREKIEEGIGPWVLIYSLDRDRQEAVSVVEARVDRRAAMTLDVHGSLEKPGGLVSPN